MKKRYNNINDNDNISIENSDSISLRNKLIGLGEVSIQKSYYPQLQRRMKELEKFKALLNQSNDLIFFFQVPCMTADDVNDFACELLGYSREQMLELHIKKYAGVQVYRWIEQLIEKVESGDVSDADTKTTLVTAMIDKQENRLPVEIKLKLVEWEDVQYIIAVASDITKHIQSEIKIKKLNVELERKVLQRTAQLEATNKELEAFSYSVSHDLRAPLRTINGFSQAILEDYSDVLDEQGHDYLDRILKASQHMGDLIDSLLLLSKSTRVDMKYKNVDMSSLVIDSVNRFSEMICNDKEVHSNIETGIYGSGDPNLLKIVLDNLIENALKYASKELIPTIEFGTKMDANKQVYYIKDNGVGFNMDYYEKLFVPFQRLHKKSEFPGTGVGLATVRRIITRHGGDIWATSIVNEGTTFYFTLHTLEHDSDQVDIGL